MNIFIAGICGTFMAGIAQLAKASGHVVRGCDANVYPPMSTLLAENGIDIAPGYEPDHIDPEVDQVIIGNALSRGNPLVEHVLNAHLPFQSGPQWLHDQLLAKRQVIAVAGTHGKTSTSSMVAWILQANNQSPGFLIGGKPGNFEHSARIGNGQTFVIEADEYDTAFFDKRSKFVHYAPDIAVLNNLEFDHGDIFSHLDQIKTQFHHLVRIVPQKGHIIVNADDAHLRDVIDMGCWSNLHTFSTHDPNSHWYASLDAADGSVFSIYHQGVKKGVVDWACIGLHNVQNALAAISATALNGIDIEAGCRALGNFIPTARRLQSLYERDSIHLYEDFAHHPTAIRHTLSAIRTKYPGHQLIAVIEPRSNTMQSGCHNKALGPVLDEADMAIIYQSHDNPWRGSDIQTQTPIETYQSASEILKKIELSLTANSVIICMSNGSFDGIPRKIARRLERLETLETLKVQGET